MLIGTNDFYLVTDPIWRKIYSAAVSAGLDPLFKHFFTVYLEFDLTVGGPPGNVFFVFGKLIIVVRFFFWHGAWPHVRITAG